MTRKTTTIAVDAMGGDHGLSVTLPAVLKFIDDVDDVLVILVGDEDKILDVLGELPDRVHVLHTIDQVLMDESPLHALKFNKKSSMRLALELVRDKEADAMVSAGNTGALVAIAKFVLKMLKGLKRPVLGAMSASSTQAKSTLFLDLGATVDCLPAHLHQFAIVGSATYSALNKDIASPKVALLNIGEENIKGNAVVKDATMLLENDDRIHFCGYVEGTDLIDCRADVVVMDGFVGNIVTKTVEGLLLHLKSTLVKQCQESIQAKLLAPIIKKSFRQMIMPVKKDTGALLLGVVGIVIKAHGGSSITDFYTVLKTAKRSVENNLLKNIKDEMIMYATNHQVAEASHNDDE